MPLASSHTVQFYENEEFLSSAVAGFLAAGIEAGEPIVVIATEPHRDAFVAELERRDVRWNPSQFRLLDARDTLGLFMDGSVPDETRFQLHIGGLIDELTNEGRVRAYGEMVDLLWRDGNREGALRLEELWNDLAGTRQLSLLCAYPMGSFYKNAHSHLFDEICRRHDHVAPAESYPRAVADDDSQLQEIARLQQRAQALKAEVEHRKDLEIALRDALAARRRAEEANAFLLDATSVLNSDLDYESRLRAVTNLAVPRLADFCAVDVIAMDGSEESYCSSGAERDDVITLEMSEAHAEVVRTGQTLVAANGAWAVVPMQTGGKTLGAITLASNHSRYTQSNNEIALTRDFASRAATAVDNARHYRAAQDANRAKDQFLATLSHELRTPLTAILGWARMLQLGDLDAETVKTAYETMERSATAQARIIDDLLDLSRVVTGKLKIKSEMVDLVSIVRNTGQTLRIAAEAKGVHIDVETASSTDSELLVLGDPTRLQQITWNLLSNAIKFSEYGGRVAIAVDRDADTARIVVNDNGRGISADFLPHVFEAFRQADGASTRSYSGLGLGLAIVKYLAEAHGGTVIGTSDGEGHGSTFVVTLPLATHLAGSADISPDFDIVDLSNTSILLVDDDADTRSLVATILKRCGAAVHAADSVATARDLLVECRPTLVLSDIAMPGQDGFALVGHIRSGHDAFSRIPVIALTASGDPRWEEKLRQSGFDAYVSKPVDPLHLVRVIFDLHRA